jgi:hypothetical protein
MNSWAATEGMPENIISTRGVKGRSGWVTKLMSRVLGIRLDLVCRALP